MVTGALCISASLNARSTARNEQSEKSTGTSIVAAAESSSAIAWGESISIFSMSLRARGRSHSRYPHPDTGRDRRIGEIYILESHADAFGLEYGLEPVGPFVCMYCYGNQSVCEHSCENMGMMNILFFGKQMKGQKVRWQVAQMRFCPFNSRALGCSRSYIYENDRPRGVYAPWGQSSLFWPWRISTAMS